MIEIDIPGFRNIRIDYFVTDFTGTLSEKGRLFPGVAETIMEVAKAVTIHVLTADTFGTVRRELKGLPCAIHLLEGEDCALEKEAIVKGLGREHTLAMGNGRNDRRMLAAAQVGVAVCLREGCAVEALSSADLLVTSPLAGLELLRHPKRLIASLRG